jgi:hypothetical protein
MDKYYNPLYSCYGTHELRVRRVGSSLQFLRASSRANLWLTLFFKTYESMPPDASILQIITEIDFFSRNDTFLLFYNRSKIQISTHHFN